MRRAIAVATATVAIAVVVAALVAAASVLVVLPPSYGKALYGADVGPIRVASLDAVDITILPAVQRLAAHSIAPNRCPTRVGGLKWPAEGTRHGAQRAYWPPCLARVHQPAPHPAAAGWTEVMHWGIPIETSVPPAAWFYHVRGSGVWIDVGKTAVYTDHGDAYRDLVGPSTSSPDFKNYTATLLAAAARGLDSLQFTQHCDQVCGCDLGEIVMLNAHGTVSCPVPMRAGPNASRPCLCDDAASVWVNCGTEWPDTCHPWALQTVVVVATVVATVAVAFAALPTPPKPPGDHDDDNDVLLLSDDQARRRPANTQQHNGV